MVLFRLNPHIIIFFFFVALLLLKQSVSEHNNVPSRLLKDSKLLVFDTRLVQDEEQDEIGSSDTLYNAKKMTKKKENVEDEEREKEGKEEVNEETKDQEDEIGKGKNKKKKNKANKHDKEEYDEFDENGKKKKDEEKTVSEEFDENEKKKAKDDDIGKGEKGMKKKVEKDDENEAYEEFDENGMKKKNGEKDGEKEAYEKFDESGRKKKKDGEQTWYEDFDENGKKKKKKDEEFHDIGMQKETKDEEKAKDKKSSSSDSFNSIESLLSLKDSLKRNPPISLTIVQGCKKADFPPECEATLLSTSKDTKKFDASSIFETSVKALSKALNVSKTLAQNPNMGINPKDTSDCEKMYKDSISALKGAMKAFKEKNKYMTSLKLSTVVTNMDTCENGIGKDSTSDLGRVNKVLSKLAANAISLGDAAMHFNTDQ